MAKYRITVGDRVHEAEVREITPPTAQVVVDGVCYTINLDDTTATDPCTVRPAASAPSPQPAKAAPVECVGEGDVVAPMPGKVIKHLVKVGDEVEAGQPVCVLEAMKMENQLPAPIAGTVVELPVSEGVDVTQRTVLVRIEAKQ